MTIELLLLLSVVVVVAVVVVVVACYSCQVSSRQDVPTGSARQ